MRNAIVRRSVWLETLGSSILIVLVGALTGIASARLLGPEARGTLAVLMLWPTLIAGLGIASLPDAVILRNARHGLSRADFMATVLATSVGLILLSVTVGWACLPFLLDGERAPWLRTEQLYLVAFLVSYHLGLSLLAIDQAELRLGRYNTLRLLPSIFYLAGLVALWCTGRLDVRTALWVSWIGGFIVMVLQLAARRSDLIGRPSVVEGTELLRTGMGFHGATVLAVLSMQADRVAVSLLMDDHAIGLYAVALTIAMAAQGVVTTSAQIVLLPRLAAAGTSQPAVAEFARGLRWVSSGLFLTSLVFTALIPWLLPLLFGPAFAAAVPTAMLLAWACLPLALRQVVGRAIRGLGDGTGGLVAEAAALLAFLPLAWLGITRLGLPGVALALLAANLLSLCVLFRHLSRRHGLRPGMCLGLDRAARAELMALVGVPLRRLVHHGGG